MKGLVDLDSMIYAAGFAAQESIRKVYSLSTGKYLFDIPKGARIKNILEEKGLLKEEVNVITDVVSEPLPNALRTIKMMMVAVLEAIDDDLECYMGGTTNFRFDIYPEYKANRLNLTKPVYYDEIREYLEQYWNAQVTEGIEADDIVSIRSHELMDNSVIVSKDKDLLTVPGYHLNPFKIEEGIFYQDWVAAKLFFYKQLLTGDSIDNIPGVKGIGEIKAKKLLEGLDDDRDMFAVVKEVYEEHNITIDILYRNARLLHMLRSRDDQWNSPS